MNRKKLKYFGLIIMLLALFTIVPVTYAKENTDAGGGDTGGDGDYVGGSCAKSGCTDFIPGIMFSVVDKDGNRLPGTTSYIVSNNPKNLKTIIPRGNVYYNKKESILNEGYIKSSSSWREGSQTINYANIKNFLLNDLNKKYGKDGYVLSYLINNKSADGRKLWEYYASKCGYSYNNYSYEEIQNHYLIFEPMVDITIGHGGGNNPYKGRYFLTYQQASILLQYLRNRGGIYKESVRYISWSKPTWENLAPGIYMPTGSAGFYAGKGSPLKSWKEVNNSKWNGNGIGSINIAKTCEDAGLDCGMPTCNISINQHFPVDDSTGEVQSIIIDSKDETKVTIVPEGTEKSVNCCSYLLVEQFGNDKDALCNERPECCYDRPCGDTSETDLNSCTSSSTGVFSKPGKDNSDTWYCMKAFDKFSPYIKKTINQYARIVCREDLKATFPTELDKQQSVGTYMVWPTSSKNELNNYSLEFQGTMTCRLSIDKAEIEASGNATNIYNDIYSQVLSYTQNGNCNENTMCEAKNWYKLNNNINLTVSYNDDEYGGTKVNLETDQEISNVTISIPNKNSSNLYLKLNTIEIKIHNTKTYGLSKETYKILTTAGSGSNNLNNMFNNINKNQFVYPQFNYGVLPISYTAKVSRNYSVNKVDYYKLTLTYRNIGDNNNFVKSEKNYTCPYEVTFAPPTNTDDNDDGVDTHDDNNDAYEKTSECVCPKGTTHCSMDLRGYLIKNSKMTCAQAQAIYCNSDRGNMNVEYRVISLTEPFPGSGETAKTMAQGGRDIGYNWRDSVDQTTSGGVVSTFILNNRRVKGYEVYNLEPLYVIELDSAKIKAIRDYNKTTTYADFNLTCVNDKDGTICTSPFLDQYVSSGTCHTAHTKDKFYKCADKDVPASENK